MKNLIFLFAFTLLMAGSAIGQETPTKPVQINNTTELGKSEIPVKEELEAPVTEPKEAEVFKVVDEMPRFPGCEDISDEVERKNCSNKKMLEFIYSNIKYPAAARQNGTQGTTIIRYYIDTDGTLKDLTIKKDIGDGCGAEALRVVGLMNDLQKLWIPGKQEGEPVKTYFNLPVKFRLSNSGLKKKMKKRKRN